MALLNLILLPILAALGLFSPDGGEAGGGDGGGDTAGAAGSATPAPPATGDTGAAAAAAAAATKDGEGDGDDAPLGEPGKKALETERAARRAAEKRAKDAETEAERLRTAGQSEQEKAIADAKKAGRTEADQVWHGRFVRAEARAALAAAGVGDVGVAVAAFLDEHRDLKVNDDGELEDLDATVQAFKRAPPTLFTARVPGGSADQGAKPPAAKRAASLEEAIAAQLSSSARPS